ncbi:MAG: DUF1015 domain-containing protein [Bacteroidota bacterium]|nr:DUF1015 domain-containing protein [Bacteroidota bacterium]MDP4231530.1 DUF1015 domain-containing protein [Bacteroidota bacterium]MDP4236147.1 DUF1015 domain-containing protein [Bacteroidota bacterium]
MNTFEPFIGTRYNTDKVRMKDVVSPPYDVISPEQQAELYKKDPHNVVRLELNHDSDPYTCAKQFFDEWKVNGILQPENSPAFYVYYQTFKTPDGTQVTRRGVLGRLRLTPYSSGDVLPHERTLSGPKKDRMQLLVIARTNFSPIFGLIDDASLVFDHTIDSVVANAPIADIDELLPTGDSVRHTSWRLTDPAQVTRLEKLIAGKKIIIADGHHRYETALAYAQANPENAAAQYMMIFIANLHSEGTIILPTHRILHDKTDFNQYSFIAELRKKFSVELMDSRDEGMKHLATDANALTLIQMPEEPKFVLVKDTSDLASSSPLEKLAVYRLHEKILKPIAGLTQAEIDNKTNLLYPHTLPELDSMLSGHDYDAAFILKPTTSHEVIDVTGSGEFMPQKSTYFYPKLLSGLVFYEFEEQKS